MIHLLLVGGHKNSCVSLSLPFPFLLPTFFLELARHYFFLVSSVRTFTLEMWEEGTALPKPARTFLTSFPKQKQAQCRGPLASIDLS